MDLSYSRVGDYLLPNIKFNEPPLEMVEPLGRYGRIRRAFLQAHHPIQYSRLVLSEQLFPHLREVDEAANVRLDTIMSDISTFNPPPEKETDSLAWATYMTELWRVAEQMVMNEVVYV